MLRLGVLDHDQVAADLAEMAHRVDRLGSVLEQPLLERRIGPGARDDAGADMRADLGLVGFDDLVEDGRVDVALLGQHRFERAHAQRHLGQLRMIVVVIVVGGHGPAPVQMILVGQDSKSAARFLTPYCACRRCTRSGPNSIAVRRNRSPPML